jgi:myosin heavy subunit
MLKIKPAERMCTGLIIEQCLAERPEERGSFLDLQIIIESFQRKYNKHPDRELLEEKQLECELLRSKMEADQVTLYNESLQELELEESKTLIAILKERVAKLEQVVSSGNSELIHLANQLKVERQQHEALQSENDLMKRERDSLKEEKAIAMQEMEDAQKRHKMELQDLQDNLLQLQQNRNEMTGEIGKLKEELALQKKFTEQKERSWESLQNEYDHLVDALKRMEREQEKRRIQLLTQKERFQAKEEEFKSKIEEITTALESNLSTFQGEKKELDLKVAKKERVIHQKEQEIAELKVHAYLT